MTPNPCSNCGSTDLKAKWLDDVGWIHCDKCGNISKPIPLEKGRIAIISEWNRTNATDTNK